MSDFKGPISLLAGLLRRVQWVVPGGACVGQGRRLAGYSVIERLSPGPEGRGKLYIHYRQ